MFVGPGAAPSRRLRAPGADPRPAPCRLRIRPRVAGRPAHPEVPGSLRRGVTRVPEDVDGRVPGEMLADGTGRLLRLLPERSGVEGEDLVEAPIAEVRVLQRDGLEHGPARVDVVAIAP